VEWFIKRVGRCWSCMKPYETNWLVALVRDIPFFIWNDPKLVEGSAVPFGMSAVILCGFGAGIGSRCTSSAAETKLSISEVTLIE
jgi:hypothetical protein